METSKHFEQIRQQIAHMDKVNGAKFQGIYPGDPKPKNMPPPDVLQQRAMSDYCKKLEAEFSHLPSLPPRLPKPAYAWEQNLISTDDIEVEFYAACEKGATGAVEAYIRTHQPSQATLQYALEQASFTNQPAIARLLLGQGAILHGNCFERRCPDPDRQNMFGVNACIFDADREHDPLDLIQAFIEAGWHPNQAWDTPVDRNGNVPLLHKGCLGNRPLVTLLLKHGADPNLAQRHIPQERGPIPLHRQSGEVLNRAVSLWDPSLIDLLLAHGANPDNAAPLFHLSVYCGRKVPEHQHVSFSQRRAMAEHLLSLGLFDVNEVKRMPIRTIRGRPPGSRTPMTAFARACAHEDYELAKWLLEHGADPYLLNSKALQPQWYFEGWMGPNNPDDVLDLIKRVERKQLELLEMGLVGTETKLT